MTTWRSRPQASVADATLTWVERHFGYGITRAYDEHTDNTGPATTYIKASLQEVATPWPS